jgi:hypothetical protein
MIMTIRADRDNPVAVGAAARVVKALLQEQRQQGKVIMVEPLLVMLVRMGAVAVAVQVLLVDQLMGFLVTAVRV